MSKLKDLVGSSPRPSAPLPLSSGQDTMAGASLPAGSSPVAPPASGSAFSAGGSPRRAFRPPWWRAWLIFLMGAGLGVTGVLVYQQAPADKAGAEAEEEAAIKSGFAPGDWISESLAKYQTTLQLRPEQANSLRGALQKASHDLRDTQERASREARQAIHLVHAQLMPMLDEKQKADFEAWRKASGHTPVEDRLPDFPGNAPATSAEPAPVPEAEPIPEKRRTGREAAPKPSGKPAVKAVPIP